MARERVTMTREELYEQVWSEPMQTLARKYGMSDRGLAKNCAHMRVPVPGRGYWAKKAVGNAPARTLLPQLPPNSSLTPSDITLTIVSRSESSSEPEGDAVKAAPPLPEPVALQVAFEAEPKNRIAVRATLHAPHRLTQRTIESLDADARHREQDWQHKPEPRLAIDVSKPHFKRAIRIMDALVKAFDRREWKVSVTRHHDEYKRRYDTSVVVLGHHIDVGIREPEQRVRNTPTAADAGKSDRQLGWHRERTGHLALTIFQGDGDHVEREIVETDDAPLETRLNDFMIDLVTVAHRRDELHRQRAEEWERQMAEDKRRRAEERRREDEAAKGRALEQQALDWALSANLLAYVAELRAVVKRRSEGLEAQSALTEWLDWAEAHAKALDPFNRPLDELAATRLQAPNPYAAPTLVEVARPQTPFWFIRNR